VTRNENWIESRAPVNLSKLYSARDNRCPLWSKSGQTWMQLECPLCARRSHKPWWKAGASRPVSAYYNAYRDRHYDDAEADMI